MPLPDFNIALGPRNVSVGRAGWFLFLVAMAAAAGLSLSLRLAGLDKGMWHDEWSSVHRLIELDLYRLVKSDPNSAFYNILLQLWGDFLDPIWFLRLPSVIFGTMTVLIVVAWLWNQSKTAALFAGSLLVFLPAQIRLSQFMRSYALMGLLTAMAFAQAENLARHPASRTRWGFGVFFGTLALLILSHGVGAFAAVSVLIFGLTRHANLKHPEGNRPFGVAVCLVTVSGLLVLAAPYVLDLSPFHRSWIKTFKPFFATLLVTDSFSFHGRPYTPELRNYFVGYWGLMVALAAAGDWRKNWPVALGAMGFLGLMLLFSWVHFPIVHMRTLSPVWIPLAAFLGLQFASLKSSLFRRFFLFAFAVLYIHWSIVHWSTFNVARHPWKEVAQYIREHVPGRTLIVESIHAGGFLSFYLPEYPTIHRHHVRRGEIAQDYDSVIVVDKGRRQIENQIPPHFPHSSTLCRPWPWVTYYGHSPLPREFGG